VPEPRDKRPDNTVLAAAASGDSKFKLQEYRAAISEVLQSSDAQILLAASALRFAAGFTIGIWKAPFVFGKFPGSESIFAGSNAAIVAGGGLLSSLLGGFVADLLADKFGKENPRVRVWVPAIGSLLAAPLWAAFVLADTPRAAASFLLAEYLAAECWVGPTLAGLYNSVPQNRRGTAQGLFSILTAVGNIAPLLVGLLVAGAAGAPMSLGDSLIASVGGAYVLSGVLFTYYSVRTSKDKGDKL
jgi:MFS family permease